MTRGALAGVVLLLTACSAGAPATDPVGSAPVPSPRPAATRTSTIPSPPAPEATVGVRPSAPAAGYTFPVAGCRVDYGDEHHDYPATDLFADEGCEVVSVTAGTVDEVSRHDTWDRHVDEGATRGGLSVSIIGDDGVRYYFSHLQRLDPAVEPGERVLPGGSLGTVGRTGSARHTPPHLHFGLSWPTAPGAWWVRRGTVAPTRYLDAWHTGQDLSPADEVQARRAESGELPPCSDRC